MKAPLQCSAGDALRSGFQPLFGVVESIQKKEITEKQCTRCKEMRPISDFHKFRFGKHGFHCWCKKCNRSEVMRRACSIKLTEKRCCRCKMVKPADEFQNSKTAIDGLQSHCRGCGRFIKIKSSFNLDRKDYEKILIEQNGVCAICKVPSVETLSVDHNHATNKVRGLLCNGCNTAIGFLKEKESNFLSAIEYLKKHQ